MGFFRGMLGGRADSGGRGIAVTTDISTTNPVGFESCAGGMVYIPSGSSITSLTFYISPSDESTAANRLPAYDDSSMSTPAAVVLTVAAGRAYPIPSCLFGCGAFWMVGNAAGTVYVTLKG